MNGNFENHDIFGQLPEETKEKLRGCKSEEEAMDILQGDMIPVPDEVLDSVAGGRAWQPECGMYSFKKPYRRQGFSVSFSDASSPAPAGVSYCADTRHCLKTKKQPG